MKGNGGGKNFGERVREKNAEDFRRNPHSLNDACVKFVRANKGEHEQARSKLCA